MASNVAVHRKVIATDVKEHPQVTNGTSPPSDAPRAIGDFYVDTSARRLWVASDATAWTVVNADAFCHRTVTGSTTVLVTDGTIGVKSETESTITLPLVSTFTQSRKRVTVTDELGCAGDGCQINILPTLPDRIVGEGYYVLSSNFASVTLYSTSDGWFVGAAS
jgi:hypothetical protein